MLTEKEALDLVLETFRVLAMTQGGLEARDFAVWLSDQDVSNVLEIGTCAGGMMYIMDRVAKPGLRVSIDMPWLERDPKLPSYWERRFKDQLPHVHEILGNSHEANQRERLEVLLAGRKLDLIFQDADHSEAGSMQDFRDYSPFLRPGGFWVMHDVKNGHGCQKTFEELAKRYPSVVFTETVNVFGIGVLTIL